MVIDIMKTERDNTYTSGLISASDYGEWRSTIYLPISTILDAGDQELSVGDQTRVRDLYYKYLSLRAWELTENDPEVFYTFLAIL